MALGGSAPARDVQLDESGRPTKQAKMSAPSQQVMAGIELEHEDEPNFTQFMDDELDYMESYDCDIEDEQVIAETYAEDVESMLDKLSRPWTKEEPEVSEDEMLELDALADFVEIPRLRQQGVLIA